MTLAGAFAVVWLSSASDSASTVQKAQALVQSQDYEGAVVLLAPLVREEPTNAQAWLAYGAALHGKGDFEEALEAHEKAASFEATKLQAMYNAARTCARRNDADSALTWLERLKATGEYNVSDVGADPELKALRGNSRFGRLLPTAEELATPFVEPGRVLHEWVGESEGDWFGWIGRDVGDVDGDGVHDVVTSAPNRDVDGPFAGKIYVYSGKSGRLLWTASGSPGGRLGIGVEAAGDVNRDGVPDVVASAPGAGKTYVYSGRDGSIVLELAEKQEREIFGRKVSDLGDVDGDGHADVFVGAPGNDEKGEDAGRSAVYSGKDGAILLEWYGEEAGDQFGSSAGGLAKGEHFFFVVGAPGAGEGDRGRTYVYRGREGKLGFIIESDEDDAALGAMFVSVVGDVDRDGVPDVYASDWSSNANGAGSGRIYVHSGATGTRLLALAGEAPGDGFGIGPADAGDVDGDGHDDLVVGAWQHAGHAPSGGKVYLFSGKDGALLRAWTAKVPGETFGFDATGMGDVDGDGSIDLLITSAWSPVRGSRTGRMFVLSATP